MARLAWLAVPLFAVALVRGWQSPIAAVVFPATDIYRPLTLRVENRTPVTLSVRLAREGGLVDTVALKPGEAWFLHGGPVQKERDWTTPPDERIALVAEDASGRAWHCYFGPIAMLWEQRFHLAIADPSVDCSEEARSFPPVTFS